MSGLKTIESKLVEDGRLVGGKAFAPNGNPSVLYETLKKLQGSKLGHETYLKLHTPQFKEWFGDWEGSLKKASTMVDKNGEPKIFYHGSDDEILKFSTRAKDTYSWIEEKDDYRRGSYFAFNPEYARKFTSKNKLIPVFLNMRKPKRSVIYHSIVNFYLNGGTMKDRIERTIDKIRGVDGFVGRERPGDDRVEGARAAVTFNPTQVKSIYNSGDFSQEKDEIHE